MKNSPTKNLNLDNIRIEINKCDTDLIKALAGRMKLIPSVAEYKKANGIERYQPEREKQIIESRRKMASDLGLNPDLVEKIMKAIIEDAHRIEIDIMGE